MCRKSTTPSTRPRKSSAQRYDFKGSKSSIDFKRAENLIELVADDNFKMDAVWDVLQTRMVRRGVPVKNLKLSKPEPIAGSLVRRTVNLQQGIPTETAKSIVKYLKDQKLKKIQAAIQSDQLRGLLAVAGRAPGVQCGCSRRRISASSCSSATTASERVRRRRHRRGRRGGPRDGNLRAPPESGGADRAR